MRSVCGKRNKGRKGSAPVNPTSPFCPPRQKSEVIEVDTPTPCETEELPTQTQALPDSPLENTEESLSGSTGSEESFREHVADMINEHGLELTKMLFQLEVMKCKKQKTVASVK